MSVSEDGYNDGRTDEINERVREMNFTVLGVPRGKSRPRFTRNGHTYTPKETILYENLVAASYDGEKLEGNLSAKIVCYFPIPSSLSKKKKAEMLTERVYYNHKPDLDNLAKIILDSLNGIAFDDDKQVVRLEVEKYYSDRPRAEIWLTEI